MFNIYICVFPLPFHPSHRQGPMFRSRTAQTPLGYLSRQLGLAAVPTPPSAWVRGTQGYPSEIFHQISPSKMVT